MFVFALCALVCTLVAAGANAEGRAEPRVVTSNLGQRLEGLAFSNGNLYVADDTNGKIWSVSVDGNGKNVDLTGPLQSVGGLRVAGDRLVAADLLQEKFFSMSLSGSGSQFQDAGFQIDGGRSRGPWAVDQLTNGSFVTTDRQSNNLPVFNRNGDKAGFVAAERSEPFDVVAFGEDRVIYTEHGPYAGAARLVNRKIDSNEEVVVQQYIYVADGAPYVFVDAANELVYYTVREEGTLRVSSVWGGRSLVVVEGLKSPAGIAASIRDLTVFVAVEGGVVAVDVPELTPPKPVLANDVPRVRFENPEHNDVRPACKDVAQSSNGFGLRKRKALTECAAAPECAGDRRQNKMRLSIATFNAEWLFLDNHRAASLSYADALGRVKLVAGVISRLNADIVALQEVEGCEVLEQLVLELDQMGDHSYQYYLQEGDDSLGQNVGLLTRVDPIKNLAYNDTYVPFPVSGGNCHGGDGMWGLSKHFFTRFAPTNFPSFGMVNVHLIAGPKDFTRCAQREAQAQIVRGIVDRNVRENPDDELVILGDLNDFDGHSHALDASRNKPKSKVLTWLKSAGGMVLKNAASFDLLNREDVVTVPGSKSAIDAILLSKPLAGHVTDVVYDHSGDTESFSSDHNPIVVTMYASKQPYKFRDESGDAVDGDELVVGNSNSMTTWLIVIIAAVAILVLVAVFAVVFLVMRNKNAAQHHNGPDTRAAKMQSFGRHGSARRSAARSGRATVRSGRSRASSYVA